jgi:hypothetical protein
MNERADIRPYKVSQIAEGILNSEFVGNTISINVKKTGYEEISYDEETKILRIPVKSDNFITIIDGAHRTLGNAKAFQIKPDIDINYSLNIFF